METLYTTVFQNLPALILLVLGFVLVLVEMHIPGFGAPGILGVLSLIAGVMLFARSATEALVITIVIVALLCIALSLVIRSATKGRLARSKLVLKEVSVPTVGENDLTFFVGKTGEALTALRPSGIAEFDGVRLNVVSDGEWIGNGRKLRVERVEGNRIVVSPVREGLTKGV
jgi:membrane-bound ClpP family serine protease